MELIQKLESAGSGAYNISEKISRPREDEGMYLPGKGLSGTFWQGEKAGEESDSGKRFSSFPDLGF
jgi:hypothetical protein